MDGPLRPMEDDIEADYLRIERAGIMDEGYWAAINGLDFEEDAMTALVKAFAPKAEEQPPARKPEKRTLPCRISCRLSVLDYNLLMDLIQAEGFQTTQDWLYSHIKKHLELKGAYT